MNDFLRYFELTMFFTKKEIAIRYKQTLLGILWIIIQPALMIFVFTIVFRKNVNIQSNIPYTVYVFSGLIFWNLFKSTIIYGQSSLLRNLHIISKIYFPRIIIPVSSALSQIVDFVIIFIIFIIYAFLHNINILSFNLFLLVIPFIVQFIFTLGLTIFISILSIFFRDIQYLTSFLISILIFLTPTIYPGKYLPEKFRFLVEYNPISIFISSYRSIMFEGHLNHLKELFILFGISCFILFVSILFLLKTERIIGDIK